MRFLVAVGLIAVAEVATFLWVGSRIGFGWALGIAVATALLGSYLVRRAGISVLARIKAKFGRGEVPGLELIEGALILVAGALLISPGLITDTLGFLLLIPTVRGLAGGVVSRRFASRVAVVASTRSAHRRGAGSTHDVIDIEDRERPGPGQLP